VASPQGYLEEQARYDRQNRLSIPDWLRNPAGAVLLAAVFFGFMGTLSLAMDVGRPFGRFLSYGFFGRPDGELVHETPRWWEPVATGSLIYGDIFHTINGLPYIPHAREEFAEAYLQGKPVVLEISRIGEDPPVIVTLKSELFTIAEYLDVKLPELLVGLVFWTLGLIVLRARPDSTTNRVFALLAACIAIHRLTALTSVIIDNNLIVNLPKIGQMMAAGLSGPLLFHLTTLFPVPLRRTPTKLLAILYSLGIWSGVVLAMSRLPLWRFLPPSTAASIETFALRLMLFLFLAGVIALFFRLIWLWINLKKVSLRERRVGIIIFVGLIASLPPVLVILGPILPFLGEARIPFWQTLDVRYFMLSMPLAFTLAIIRYHAFQSPSPLFISVIVLSLSALIAAVATAVWEFVRPASFIPTERPPFILFFIFIFIPSYFWSRQADWRGLFGRFLNRTDRNYDAVREFGSRVMGRNDIKVLPATMAQALVDELELERAAVWLWDSNSNSYKLVGFAGVDSPAAEKQIFTLAPLYGRAIGVAWPSTPSWIKEPAMRGHFEALVPLAAEGRSIGLLGLGSRWDEEIFDERDLAVAELVGQQAVLFLTAAIQVDELRRVPARVAEAQERERYRLAGELHDTIQQFLGRLPFFLAVSQELIDTDRDGAWKLLDRCMDDVEDAARVLREIRANLAPNQLETNLIKPLDRLTDHVRRRTNLAVYLNVPEHLDESTTVSTRHALYRVIQQALDNTIAHAEATEVEVTLRTVDDRVLFSVADNGKGATEMALQASQAQGSFGLRSMRARLEAVGGEFAFVSNTEQGTIVSGWVPTPLIP
jgi:signal transduction histidine kinase